ncbi:TetR/AcrR family transcriptional regulator [Mumia zhuanghuii]|uniref:TetR/AcrR family transcriptional regulator n=2 Tax=Mumia TaxID=1546255 RepID=A0ABW1QM69_9ACTN|nr:MULTISPECIES: TetR/AcrR family transcriptional regulator [Mumia]KAA1419858.1 TetR/AcrR family transcriptional regulator [Mumia zhuanghuii]
MKDARSTMVAGAASMIGRRGVGATSVRELAKHTGAPLGSTYHYFPGGKDQLVAEAVTWVSDRIEVLLGDSASALDAFDAFVESWRRLLRSTDFHASCPVLAVATEAPDLGESGESVASQAFARWHGLITARLEGDGIAADDARALAWTIIAGAEGAVVLARSQRSTEPLDAVAARLRSVVADAVDAVA